MRNTADGVVVQAEMVSGGYGRLVIIDHGGGFQTYYAHLSKILVHAGQELHRGEVIVAAGQGEVLLVLGGEHHALPDLAHLGEAEGPQAEEHCERQRGADQLEDAAVVGFQPDAHHGRVPAASS